MLSSGALECATEAGEMTTVTTAVDAGKRIGGRSIRWPDLMFLAMMYVAVLFTFSALLLLLAAIFTSGASVIAERGVSFLSSSLSSNPEHAGVGQAIWGTIVLGVIVSLVAIPLGVATAVYLEEYAPDNRLTRVITINIRNLAGVP